MLTLFTLPRPFEGVTDTNQKNAIRSWTLLEPRPEVIIFGDEQGAAEAAADLQVRHLSGVSRNEFGTPLLDSFFSQADREASYDYLGYINADLILMQDFMEAVQAVLGYARAQDKKRFLMIGRRWNIDPDSGLDFKSSGWDRQLRDCVHTHGSLMEVRGIDIFVYPRYFFHDMPPFAIGRIIYDNWMIYKARSMRVPVIDTTDQITVVHLDHDYSFHPQGHSGVRSGEEAQRNLELAGGLDHIFDTRDADWRLTSRGVEHRPRTLVNLRQEFVRSPHLHPAFAFPLGLITRVYHFFKPWLKPFFGDRDWYRSSA